MRLRSLHWMLVAGLVALLPAAAWAQTPRSTATCKPEISVTGTAALTEAGAKENARSQWRRTVFARYGDFYGTFEQAKGASERCVKTLLKLTRCELRAQPCEATTKTSAGTYANSTEIPCERQDSIRCEPIVKWVQSRLNVRLGANLKVDGADGTETRAAIKRFKREQRLPDPNAEDITPAFIDALKA